MAKSNARRDALEEAAQIADEFRSGIAQLVAAAIRARIKEKENNG